MKLKKGYSEELKKLFAYTESLKEFEARIIQNNPEKYVRQYARDFIIYEGDEAEKLVSFLKKCPTKKGEVKHKKYMLENFLEQKQLEYSPLEIERWAFNYLSHVGEFRLREYLTQSGMGEIFSHLQTVTLRIRHTINFLKEMEKYRIENSFLSFKKQPK
tara:strand:+ start:158 stop:634 length:477 start_codon:yes stop_codon:yes gene_type:complete